MCKGHSVTGSTIPYAAASSVMCSDGGHVSVVPSGLRIVSQSL